VTGHIYVINGDSGSFTMIDPETNTTVSTIDVGAGLDPGVADGNGTLFVASAANDEIDQDRCQDK
jgi:YVTN family beta-propeller protein